MLHKVRDLLVRQRTLLINALRGHLAEFGIVAAQEAAGVKSAITQFRTEQASLPELARSAIRRLIGQIEAVTEEVRKAETEILAWCRNDTAIRRLLTIPGHWADHCQRDRGRAWAKRLLERKPARVVSMALANKSTRIAWAVMTRGDVYRAPAV